VLLMLAVPRLAEEVLLAPISDGFTRYAHQLEARRQRESKEVLDKFEKLAKEAGVRYTLAELKAKHGDPREALCNYCAEKKARLLVLREPWHWASTKVCGPAQGYVCGHVFSTQPRGCAKKQPALGWDGNKEWES